MILLNKLYIWVIYAHKESGWILMSMLEERPYGLNKDLYNYDANDARNLYFDEDRVNNLGTSAMLARSGVPESHRRVADSYMIIKKIFGFPAVHSRISHDERKFLARFDFNALEYSTIKQINDELSFLKKWSDSKDSELQHASNNIINIRLKELKHLIATSYVDVTSEIYNGYKALERYFEEISKYN